MTKMQFWLLALVGCILGYLACVWLCREFDVREAIVFYSIWYAVIFLFWSLLVWCTGGLFGILQ